MTDNPTPPNTPESDTELRKALKHIARFKFGPFKNTVPAKILLMPADNDHKSNGVGMEWSYDAFIDDVVALVRKDRKAVAREAMINELRILEREDAQYPPHELDIPDYIEYRLTALNQEKQKGGEDE